MNKVISLGPAMPQTNKEKRKEEKIEARSPFSYSFFSPFDLISSLIHFMQIHSLAA